MLIAPIFSFGQTFEKKDAEKIISGSKLIRLNEKNKSIKYIKLKDDYVYSATNQANWLNKSLKFTKYHSLKLTGKETDKKGFSHEKYQIYYKNLPVEGAVYSVHSKNGKVNSANGEYILGQNIETIPLLNEQQAFEHAIKYVHAEKYKWESENTERPKGELTILPVDSLYVLSYKFDIYAINPLSRQYIFVNANTGEIIKTFNRIQDSDAVGTAKTMYNGTVSITTDYYNSSYRLRESGRGGGIETYNLNHGTNYASATDFIDDDNYWNDSIDYNNAAYDAHYATEATYDYYYLTFGRNSYDNAGGKLLSYVHYSHNYVNAFWDGTCMTYGDGDGVTYLPLTPIEVVAHELTHGVTEHSAGLIYSGESGALNESFSDIFGTVVDFYKNPTTANYLMGDAMSVTHTPFRSMQDPNAYGDPDTYKGLYWDTYEEVHTNSGVQNFWFYLLCEGGTGTNDIGNSYNVSGIGREKGAQIAYRNLTVYLTPSATYADARFYSIQAAADLYGDCSPEVIAVTNAWYAVGVGASYNNSVIADFVVSKTNACDTNSPIYFSNRSSKANIFRWDFGDGQTDTARNPVHVFRNTGTYSVQLISEGIAACNNSDTVLKQNLISVSNSQAPIAADCAPHTLYPGGGGIYQFILNTINNTTKGSMDDYRDYSCNFQTTVKEGKEYDLYIKVGANHAENVKLWIDLNNNGRFDDAGELVFQKNKVTIDFSEKIIIPGGAQYNTPLRLRIASDFTGYTLTNACSNTNYGQFQDYTIYIQQNNSKPEANFVSDKQLIAKGDTIRFKDATLNLPNTWSWDFPGGTPSTSTLQNPVVVYNTPGNYNVSLIAGNSYGLDTVIKNDHVKVLDQLYCRSLLGGGGCPGDISLVSIAGSSLNNTNHNSCSTSDSSTYGSYPATGNTTATLNADTTYRLSVTTTYSDIISVWIDYNQNGVFEASEWTQVTTSSSPNVPSVVNLTVPSTALRGKTGMRIRSRSAGSMNGAGDACTMFYSGITEDYFITINNLPRPKNFTASITNASTGEVGLNWTYSASAKNSALEGSTTNGFSPLTFTKFKIYRNGTILDSTLNNSYTDMLPAYGNYKYEVKTLYDIGESGSADPVTLGWYGNPQISVSPLSFSETLMTGDSVTRTMTISNNGNGLLIFNINKQKIVNFNPLNFKVEPLVSKQSAFTNQNSLSNDKISEVAIVKRITSKTLNPKGLENILVFEGNSSGYAPYDTVIHKLGLSRTFVNNWNDLNTQLTNGTKWDLVIVNSYSSLATTNALDQLEIYRAQGGKLIYADWGVYNYSSHALLSGLGIQWVSDIFTPLNIFAVNISHPIFNNPNHISQLNWSLDQANRDGQIVDVLPGATQLAQFEGFPGSGAIVLKNTGNSIFNAFQAINFTRDDNGNGISDIEELIENEVTYLDKGVLQDWISVNPVSDTLSNGQSTIVNIKFNAKNLKAGLYADTLAITSTALLQPKVKVPCSLNVLGKPTSGFKGSKTTIMVGNNVQFTDLSSGTPTLWQWLMPGGSPSSSIVQNPLVTYNTSGSYDVTLIATNTYGSDTIIKKKYITVLPKLVANFYASTTSATTGSYVYFYDSSTNNPTSWKWTFMGATPSTSTYSSPSVVYNAAGTYDVKLVVSNSGGSDSIVKTGYITVTVPPKPVASFYANPTSTTTGSYIYFYDNSTNSPTSRKWTFTGGTPSTSTSSSPSVVYNTPGIYDVKLVVSNSGGSDSILKAGYITVTPPPKPVANFSSSTNITQTGSSIYFYDNSTNSPTSRKWTFTGGTPSTSTSSSPSVVYNTPGLYDIKLVVSNAGGSDSIVKIGYITITTQPKPVANFYSGTTNITTGTYVYFNDNSGNSPTSWKWTFIGGTPSSSTSSSPSVQYNSPGTYDVKLVVSNTSGSDSIIKTGYITVALLPKPVANFSVNGTTITPGTSVYFSDISTNSPTSWKWTFTGGTPSTSTSSYPTVLYNTTGTYDVKLVVSNAGGSDSITRNGFINVVTTLPGENCTNAQDLSLLTSPYSSSTAGYHSDFTFCSFGSSPDRIFYIDVPNGNTLYIGQTYNDFDSRHTLRLGGSCPGTTELVCVDDPDIQTHTYVNTTGSVQRVYFILGGYSSSYGNFTLAWRLTSPAKPIVNFTADKTNVQVGSYVYFTDQSSGIPTSWQWYFAGGSPSSSSSANPSAYYSTPGTYSVKLVASNAYGKDSLIKINYITVASPPKPVTSFYASPTKTTTGSSVYFYDNSTNSPTSWKWTFTGGTPSFSTSSYTSVVYNTPGLYTVKLVVSNAGGSDSITKTQYITVTSLPKPVANFYTNNTKVIIGSYIYFYSNSANNPTSYKWTFTGGTISSSTSSSPYVGYNTLGTYDVKLVVSNAAGSDSITKVGYITVSLPPRPVANFYASPTSTTVGSYVYFYDNSTNSPTSWKWTFTGGTPSSSTSSSPSVAYNTPGSYSVKLVVKNAGGSDSITKNGYITITLPPRPVANFYASPTSTTVGSYIYFYDNSTNSPTSWKWTFTGGTPSSSTSSSPSVVYNTPGAYNVKLVVKNAGGSDSITKTGYITITLPPKPVANFYANVTSTTPGTYIYFYDNSSNSPTSRKWTFTGGTPSTSILSSPSIVYNAPGSYNVQLVVSNAVGSDSIVKTGYITVTSPSKPVASFSASTNNTQTGSSIYFYDNSTNNPTSRQWTFTGGSPLTSTSSSPSVVYNTPGIYDVKLVVSNAGGSDAIIKTGYITVLNPDFKANTTVACQNESIQFTDLTTGNPVSWQWSFPNGSPASSATQNPSVVYSTSGSYPVSLTVNGTITITKTNYLVVNEKPQKATISKTNDKLFSSALNGNHWYSKMDGIFKDSTAQSFKPSKSGNFFVIVSVNGCYSDTSNILSYIVTNTTSISLDEQVSVYPVPVAHFLNIESSSEIESIEVSGIPGNIIIKQTSLNTKKVQVNMSAYSAGMYILKVFLTENPKAPVIRKILKDY